MTERLPSYRERLLSLAARGPLRLYCCGSPERSEAVAALLEHEERPAYSLSGGYRAYRRWVQAVMAQPRALYVLAGYTGSRKTEVLAQLRAQRQGVVDLESLARHRGSVFGDLATTQQPSQQQFENQLAERLARQDPHSPLWIEDESRWIGRCELPAAFYAQLGRAPRFWLALPRTQRVRHIVQRYGHAPADAVALRLQYLRQRLGPDRLAECYAALDAGERHRLADQLLQYYDRAYERAHQRRNAPTSLYLATAQRTPLQIAQRLARLGEQGPVAPRVGMMV
jgi:tRNA 2-selenouridine synthase